MSCQAEPEGSADGAGEGESGERGAAEVGVESGGMRNLVSLASICIIVGRENKKV